MHSAFSGRMRQASSLCSQTPAFAGEINSTMPVRRRPASLSAADTVRRAAFAACTDAVDHHSVAEIFRNWAPNSAVRQDDIFAKCAHNNGLVVLHGPLLSGWRPSPLRFLLPRHPNKSRTKTSTVLRIFRRSGHVAVSKAVGYPSRSFGRYDLRRHRAESASPMRMRRVKPRFREKPAPRLNVGALAFGFSAAIQVRGLFSDFAPFPAQKQDNQPADQPPELYKGDSPEVLLFIFLLEVMPSVRVEQGLVRSIDHAT
jgi:hypothetical protein